jgi:hypothetical protein
MPKVFVRGLSHSWKDSPGDLLFRSAVRGEVLDLSKDLAEEACAHGVCVPYEPGMEEASVDSSGTIDETQIAPDTILEDPANSLDALIEWMEAEGPTVEATLERTVGHAPLAQRILEAENVVSQQNPRAGVVAGVRKLVEQSGSGLGE